MKDSRGKNQLKLFLYPFCISIFYIVEKVVVNEKTSSNKWFIGETKITKEENKITSLFHFFAQSGIKHIYVQYTIQEKFFDNFFQLISLVIILFSFVKTKSRLIFRRFK